MEYWNGGPSEIENGFHGVKMMGLKEFFIIGTNRFRFYPQDSIIFTLLNKSFKVDRLMLTLRGGL